VLMAAGRGAECLAVLMAVLMAALMAASMAARLGAWMELAEKVELQVVKMALEAKAGC
jgi:hypothetical protein